jgi:trehalose 6-phosphate phosphatase
MHTYHQNRSVVRQMPPPPPLDISRHALFLDVDGTLVGIQERPELVLPEPDLTALLALASQRMNGAIAILTGRTVLDADRILERVVPCISGVHGQECRIDGIVSQQFSLPESWLEARAALAHQLTARKLDAHVEDKGSAIALHYRHVPEQASAIKEVVESAAASHGLRALHGKLVSELMPPGTSKGAALAAVMKNAPFAGRLPVAIGDDVTDEDAFITASELGGIGILVGNPRVTSAVYNLEDFAAVRAWLKEGLS